MASFEVWLCPEIEAEGHRLVGPDGRSPRIALEAGRGWERTVEEFLGRVLGGDLPAAAELRELETVQEGLFPELLVRIACYLPRRTGPAERGYSWKPPEKEPPAGADGESLLDPDRTVTLYTDGGSRGNPGPAGIGALLLQEETGFEMELSTYIGRATNNEAEYRALIEGLRLALEQRARKVAHKSDSQLLVRQLEGAYKVKSPELATLYREARSLIFQLASFSTSHIPRGENRQADALVNQAIDAAVTGTQEEGP